MINDYSSISPRSPEGGQPVKRGKLPIAFLEEEVRCKRDFLEVLMLIIIFFYLKANVGNRFVLLQIELLIKGFNFGYFFGYTVAVIDVVIGIEYFMPCSV